MPALSRDVAVVKLEQKFKDAMDQIANLSAENEHLEHLNIQLQEETETVGKTNALKSVPTGSKTWNLIYN